MKKFFRRAFGEVEIEEGAYFWVINIGEGLNEGLVDFEEGGIKAFQALAWMHLPRQVEILGRVLGGDMIEVAHESFQMVGCFLVVRSERLGGHPAEYRLHPRR